MDRVRRLEYAGGETTSQDSRESLSCLKKLSLGLSTSGIMYIFLKLNDSLSGTGNFSIQSTAIGSGLREQISDVVEK